MFKIKRLLSNVTILMLAFGIVARAWYYFSNRSLFIDEANIARNVYEKDYGQLIGNLNYEQHAPPVFMWILKALCSIFDYSEYSLRLFPFLCGVASLALFYKLAKKTLKPYSIWLAVSLFASNYILVQFSSECKQYECDAFIAVAFLYLFYNTEYRLSRIFIGILGALLIWISMPAIFMLGALGIYLIWQTFQHKRSVIDLAIIFSCWIISFALLYYVNLNSSLHTNQLLEFHEKYFIQIPYNAVSIENFKTNIIEFFRNVTGKSLIGKVTGMLFVLVAVVYGIRKKEYRNLLLWAPLVLCVFASFLKQYSLIARLMAFSFPFIIILMGKGLEVIIDFVLIKIKTKAFNSIIISVLFALGIICVVTQDNFPFVDKRLVIEEIKPVLGFVKKESIPGSVYFVHHNALPAFKYYTNIHPNKESYMPNGTIIYGTWETDYINLIQNAEKIADQKHWFIFDHFYGEDLEKLNSTIATLKLPVKKITTKSAGAYLY